MPQPNPKPDGVPLSESEMEELAKITKGDRDRALLEATGVTKELIEARKV